MNEGRFFPADCAALPAGTDECFLHCRNDGRNLRIPLLQYELFRHLTGCVEAGKHLATMSMADRHGVSPGVLSGILNEWVTKGLLREEKLLTAAYRNHPRPGPANPLTGVVLTANRPDSFRELLAEHSTRPDYLDHSIPLLVCDESPSLTARTTIRSIVGSVSSVYSGAIHYIGREEKNTFALKLVDACRSDNIPSHVIEFALFGPAASDAEINIGAGRNTAMLVAGTRNLLFDGRDVADGFIQHPEADSSGYAFVPGEYLHHECFPNSEELDRRFRRVEDFDLAGRVGESIGSSIVPDVVGGDDLSMLPPAMARYIEGGTARIGVVCPGFGGDRQKHDLESIVGHRFFADDSFYRDREIYREVLQGGISITSARRQLVANGVCVNGDVFALDSSLSLPPFFPVGEQSGHVFAKVLGRCHPDVCMLQLPVARYHQGHHSRPAPPEHMETTRPMSGVVLKLIFDDVCTRFISDDAEVRLTETGQRCRELALLAREKFERYLQSLLAENLGRRITHLRHLLNLYNGEPEWWAADVTSTIVSLEAELTEPLRDLPPDFQHWIGLYGELMEAWNLIRRRAAEIDTSMLSE